MECLPRNQQALRNKQKLKEAKKKSKKTQSFLTEIQGKSDEEVLRIAEHYLILRKDTNNVIEAIRKSIQQNPDKNGTKYLIVAETLQGLEAVNYFKKGIETLEKDKLNWEENKGENTEELISNKIASAMSSIAELYMTPPLCDQADAEQTCETALLKALEYYSENIDALQGLANIRIMRARDQEAIELLNKVVEIVKQKSKSKDPNDMPPFEFRLQTARLLIELQNFDTAVRPLDTLIKEDDSKGEVWYLLAFCYYNQQHSQSVGGNDQMAMLEVATDNIQNAHECIRNAIEWKDIDNELKEAANELSEKIKEELGVIGDTSVSEEQHNGDADSDEFIDQVGSDDEDEEDEAMDMDQDVQMQ